MEGVGDVLEPAIREGPDKSALEDERDDYRRRGGVHAAAMADALSTLIAKFEALEAAYRADVEVGATHLLDAWGPTHPLPSEEHAFSGVA